LIKVKDGFTTLEEVILEYCAVMDRSDKQVRRDEWQVSLNELLKKMLE